MNIRIAENLRAFRIERGNTQEELSNYLGISAQAVSKWERGEGFPEISLLPYIAAYYKKSVDELLGCGELQRNERLEELKQQFKAKNRDGQIEEAISLMREGIREFPHNMSLVADLVHALLFSGKEEYLDETVELCSEILHESVEDEKRFYALQSIVCAYGRQGNMDKAKEYARKLPSINWSRNIVLAEVLEGEECVKVAQENIMTMVRLLDNSVMWMLERGTYTLEEKIFAYETVGKLYKLFLYDENYGLEHTGLYTLWMRIAREYAISGEEEKTVNALKNAYMHAVEADNLKPGRYTSIFADRSTYSLENVFKNKEVSCVGQVREATKDEIFDFIRERVTFKEILE